jgi:riboflavin synthase
VFTGIVKELGTVHSLERSPGGVRLRIAASFASDLSQGDSVAVNGVCLTATVLHGDSFEADVMNQTLRLTGLGGLDEGDRVNLEPALRAGDPLGGHIVQGHVDCTAEVESTATDGIAKRIRFILPEEYRRYVVEQGSVTVEGVSLTVAALTDEGFEVSLIPETLERTTLGELAGGGVANVEIDVLARYVRRLLQFERMEAQDG